MRAGCAQRPGVPGLAPGACIGGGGIERLKSVRYRPHPSPRREPGDTASCSVPRAMRAGCAQRPGVPGLAPGACIGRGGIEWLKSVRYRPHPSPRREPGDTASCYVPRAMRAGFAQRPGVPGLAPGACIGGGGIEWLKSVRYRPHPSPRREPGDTASCSVPRAMRAGCAQRPGVPGLAPGACIGGGGIEWLKSVRYRPHPSPRREPGDTASCSVPRAMRAGCAQRPGVPGLAPGACIGRAWRQ
jgi:hypothetical protein